MMLTREREGKQRAIVGAMGVIGVGLDDLLCADLLGGGVPAAGKGARGAGQGNTTVS